MKINKETQVLNDTLDEMNLIDIFRTFHPNIAEYSFFSKAHGTFSRIDHILLFSCPVVSDSCDPMDCCTPGSPVLQYLLSLFKLMSIESVMPSNHLILCHPLPFLPSIPPSIRVFSNESALRIRWPKYWSFSFNISPSNKQSGAIS